MPLSPQDEQTLGRMVERSAHLELIGRSIGSLMLKRWLPGDAMVLFLGLRFGEVGRRVTNFAASLDEPVPWLPAADAWFKSARKQIELRDHLVHRAPLPQTDEAEQYFVRMVLDRGRPADVREPLDEQYSVVVRQLHTLVEEGFDVLMQVQLWMDEGDKRPAAT